MQKQYRLRTQEMRIEMRLDKVQLVEKLAPKVVKVLGTMLKMVLMVSLYFQNVILVMVIRVVLVTVNTVFF